MKVKVLLAGVFCMFVIMKAVAQEIHDFAPKTFPKSPEVAAIDRYGDYPTNLFAGLPAISIPLYEINAGDFKIPVVLNYHASGIKVNEKAGWAGLGWAISTGGQISRKVRGKPDEDPEGFLTNKIAQAATLNPETQNGMYFLSSLRKGQYDTEPDIFTYSFGDKNGKFFFNAADNFKVAPIPYSPLFIQAVKGGEPFHFRIRDESGNRYTFGKTVRETTSVGSSDAATSAWLMEDMISQTGSDTVSFSYYPFQDVEIPDNTHIWVVEDNVYNYDPSHPAYFPNSNGQSSINSSGNINSRLLNEIKYKNGKVVFELSAAARQDPFAGNKSLDAIKVYGYDYAAGQYQLQKTIRFFTSYFINGSNVLTKRLRLDSLYINDNTGTPIQVYRFAYNTSKILPEYTSLSRDYWGYYNGKTNSSLIPRMTVPYQFGSIVIGSDTENGRDPDNDYMQACVLKRIQYPAGGFTDFEYEANRYDEMGLTKLAGGLRIRSIKSYTGAKSKPIVKTYEYITARPNFTLRNHFFTNRVQSRLFTIGLPGYICPQYTGAKDVTSYVSSPSIDIEPFDAVPVAYSLVKEYLGDKTSNSGYTEYVYSDRPDAMQTASMVGRAVLNSFFYERGQLLKKTDYMRTTAGTYSKVKEEENTYTAFPLTSYDAAGFVTGKRLINDERSGGSFTSDVDLGPYESGGCASGYYHDSQSYLYSYYHITSDDNYLTSNTVTTYDADDPSKFIIVKKEYKFDNTRHQQVSRIITTDSKGNVITISNKYAADFLPVNGTSTGNVVLDSMIAYNMHAAVIENISSINGTEGLSGNFVNGALLHQYKLLPGKAVVEEQHQQLQTTALLTNFQPVTVNAGLLKPDTRYSRLINMDVYDNNSKLLQYTTRNMAPNTIIWDYAGALPIAEVKGAAVMETAYTSFEANGKGNWSYSGAAVNDNSAVTGKKVYALSAGAVTVNGLNTASSYIVSYWSKTGSATVNSGSGIAGMVKNGWTYYEHRISAGVAAVQVSGSITLDELRLFPAGALMTTYTYDPQIGVNTVCTPDNIITSYEYDSSGRLKVEKDGNRHIVNTYDYHYKN